MVGTTLRFEKMTVGLLWSVRARKNISILESLQQNGKKTKIIWTFCFYFGFSHEPLVYFSGENGLLYICEDEPDSRLLQAREFHLKIKIENLTSKWKLVWDRVCRYFASCFVIIFESNNIIFNSSCFECNHLCNINTMLITFSCRMSSKLRSVIALVALDQLFLILPKLGSVCFP